MKQKIILISEPGEKEVVIRFDREGQEEEVVGLVIGRGKGEYKLKVLADHLKGKTSGKVMIRGVVLDEASVEVEGEIKIREDAQGVDDFLEMKILVIGEKAKAMAEPSLEIEANDVKASHAATVGRIDEDELFYLQSRGISEEKSKQILIKGFVHKVIERIEDKEEKDKAKKAMEAIM